MVEECSRHGWPERGTRAKREEISPSPARTSSFSTTSSLRTSRSLTLAHILTLPLHHSAYTLTISLHASHTPHPCRTTVVSAARCLASTTSGKGPLHNHKSGSVYSFTYSLSLLFSRRSLLLFAALRKKGRPVFQVFWRRSVSSSSRHPSE